MKKSITRLGALAAASMLVLAGCAEAPTETTGGEGSESSAAAEDTAAADDAASEDATASEAAPAGDNADFKACMVSDFGGFDDKSFNETSYNGLLQAQEELGIEIGQIESNTESEYAGNIQSQVDAGCNVIVTVGFALAKATEAAAKQNPDIDFAIVDFASFEGVDNAKGLLFNAAEPSFLAGYAAAAVSKTGTVGTFGGTNYPTVSIFMDGFEQGVKYHNEAKGTDVKVLGWSEEQQNGQFIGGNDPFGDIPGGKNTAATLISQGADVIMPVAGPAGQGALQAAQESGGKVKVVWVDTDGTQSAPEFADTILTSAEKGMDVAVFEAIKASMEGNFSSEEYVGTLENNGAAVSELNSSMEIPEGLADEIAELEKKIIAGEIEITSPSQP